MPCCFEAEPKKDIKPYIKNINPSKNKAKGSQYFFRNGEYRAIKLRASIGQF
jgi:hypothetical protein